MPSIALLSDIHSNIHALRAVLRDVAACLIQEIVFCGDLVGYGPHSAECVKLVRESGGRAILGNHDYYTLVARERPGFLPSDRESRTNPVLAGIRHALKSLDDDALDWLGTLPMALKLPGALVTHASLHDCQNWPYLRDAASALPTLELLSHSEVDVGFFGHTHRQEWFALPGTPAPEALSGKAFRIPEGGVCAVLVGSVGQPRTSDTRAAWTVWDSDAHTFDFRRTEYPSALAAADIREAGLPESSARRLVGGS
jgi:predicted phosphodiesterase